MTLLLARLVLPLVLAAPIGAAPAEKVYARVPFPALELTSGELPKSAPSPWSDPRQVVAEWPYAAIDGEGEVYVDLSEVSDLSAAALSIDVAAPRDVTGRLFVSEGDDGGMRKLEFRIPATAFRAEGREEFLRIKAEHYEKLLAHDLPGAAWFRYQGRAARKALGQELSMPARFGRWGGVSTSELEDTFELFGGGRAIAENLQLDRELPFAAQNDATVDLDSIPGVATAAYDWTKEIEGLKPELDPLATYIPGDQYAAFFPSVEALSRTLDELEEQGNPVLSLAERKAENAHTRERYLHQLCLPIDDPTSKLRSIPITQIAITGSDPFFRTGTDVTVLIATPQPEALFEFLREKIEAARRTRPDARSMDETDAQGICESVITPDRELSCQLLHWPDTNVVMITNKLGIPLNLGVAMFAPENSIAGAPEYVFFRNRYPRGEQGEEGFLVLADAALRRWVGPRARIAASRRTQAAAWLADAQCAKLAFDSGDAEAVLPRGLPDGSALVWDEHGARSEKWGTTSFLTPIAELEIEKVTPAEEQAYARFRERYQASWRAWFDPIAVRLTRRGGALEADLTVRPLIAGSDYRGMMDVVAGGKLAPGACDPHDGAWAQFAMAFDSHSEPARFASQMLAGNGPEPLKDALDWIGGGIGVYLEADDELFQGWREAKSKDEEDLWFEEHVGELPLALHIDSKSPIKLAVFMTSLRAFIEQTAPGLLTWGTKERDGHTLVEIRASLGDAPISIWYATMPEALVVTLREDVLWSAVQRIEARRDGKAQASPRTWLGESAALRIDRGLLRWIRDLTREQSLHESQSVAWSALPILREYHQRFPDRDPFELHATLFGTHLEDPAGATYVWDELWSTHSASLYGHPGAPIAGPSWPLALERLNEIGFGVTFEADGLRARARLER